MQKQRIAVIWQAIWKTWREWYIWNGH